MRGYIGALRIKSAVIRVRSAKQRALSAELRARSRILLDASLGICLQCAEAGARLLTTYTEGLPVASSFAETGPRAAS